MKQRNGYHNPIQRSRYERTAKKIVSMHACSSCKMCVRTRTQNSKKELKQPGYMYFKGVEICNYYRSIVGITWFYSMYHVSILPKYRTQPSSHYLRGHPSPSFSLPALRKRCVQVLAYDIECTKAPLKFPNVEIDQVEFRMVTGGGRKRRKRGGTFWLKSGKKETFIL